ncbi:MAG: hypothetical protein IKJ51_11415 [Clostridia bacterium]|nr:hypothetical protein [Clostridia bacterium]
MSGPKVSSYELERRRQERLRREREEQERRERERIEREKERKRVEALKRKFSSLQADIKRAKETLVHFMDGISGRQFDLSAFDRFVREVSAFEAKYGSASSVCGTGREKEEACNQELSYLHSQVQHMMELRDEVHSARLKGQRDAAVNALKQMREERKSQEEKAKTETGKKAQAIQKTIQKKMAALSAEFPEESEAIEGAQKAFDGYCRNYAAQPDQLYQILHQFQSDTLHHLQEDANVRRFRREVRMRYEALCAVAQVKPMDYEDSFAVVIEQACKELEKVLDERREKEYVRKSICECMQELGYRMMGERTDETDDPVHQMLYAVEGTKNVLRVTCNPNGQTVIELGKGESESRTVQPREIKEMVTDMEEFCRKGFPEIRRKLMEKGITLNEECWMPAIAECAQIIGTSAFYEEQEQSMQSVYDNIVTRALQTRYIDENGG